MSDQWKASIRTIAGVPAALIDVTITRTILVDPKILQEVHGVMLEAGLGASADFTKAIQQLPPDMRLYTSVPWTDADVKELNLQLFAELIQQFQTKAFWRVEGSAQSGFSGVLNLGGVERRIDMSQAALAEFAVKIGKTEAEAKQDYDDGKIKQEEWEQVKKLCGYMQASYDECYILYEWNLKEKVERERQRREQLEGDRLDREHRLREKANYVGSFPNDWYDKFNSAA